MRVSFSLALLLVLGCEDGVTAENLPGRLASAYCGAQADCCSPPDEVAGGCQAAQSEAYREARDAARAAGLQFDSECADAWVTFLTEARCLSTRDLQRDSTLARAHSIALQCSIFHGDRGDGDSCTDAGTLGSDCAPGLECLIEMCQPKSNGNLQRLGQSCAWTDTGAPLCEAGLVCIDWGIDGDRCEHAPDAGDACHGHPGAGDCGEVEYLSCDQETFTCEPSPKAGEPCAESSTPCNEGLRCASGVCLEAGADGDPCESSSECQEDAYCTGAGVCESYGAPPVCFVSP